MKRQRPQDKNLVPLTERSPEEAFAIRSAGGKASQKKQRERRMISELLELYSELPVTDGRRKNRLKRLGINDDDLSQKMLIVDAIMRSAQEGNTYAIQIYLDLMGENGPIVDPKSNNLLDAIIGATKEDIDANEIPEVQPTTEPDSDVVE